MKEENYLNKEMSERLYEFFGEPSNFCEREINSVNESNNSIIKSISPLLSEMKPPKKHYICKKCKKFPLIDLINKNEIYYTCECYKRKKIVISDLLIQKNNFLYFENKSNSTTRSNLLNQIKHQK